MSSPDTIDGLVFFGAPIRHDSALAAALLEVEDALSPPDIETLCSRPEIAVDAAPMREVASRVRAAGQDALEKIQGTDLYLLRSGEEREKHTLHYAFAEDGTYVPLRHLCEVGHLLLPPKKVKEARESLEAKLKVLGVPEDQLHPIGLYVGVRKF